MPILSRLPPRLIAGTTWRWTKAYGSYAPPTWSATVYFESRSGQISQAAVADGQSFAFSVAANVTATLRRGVYRWTERVTDGTIIEVAERGEVYVEPDPSAAGTIDQRSPARVMLDNVERYLMDPGNLQAASYSLAGRSLARWSRSELLVERDKLRAEVSREERAERLAAGLSGANRLQVRF